MSLWSDEQLSNYEDNVTPNKRYDFTQKIDYESHSI